MISAINCCYAVVTTFVQVRPLFSDKCRWTEACCDICNWWSLDHWVSNELENSTSIFMTEIDLCLWGLLFGIIITGHFVIYAIQMLKFIIKEKKKLLDMS